MKFHDELNQIIFDKDNDNQMRPKVIAKLKEIANAFIEYLEIPEDAVLDMVVTGSSASYNYNKYSDLDLHIIVDYDKIHEDCPLVEGYLGALKNTFNKEHDIFIKDVPVELYAEKKDQGTVHNGLYSVQEEEWIDRPKKIPPTDNDAAVEAKFNEIKEMVDKCNDSEEATELLEKIYSMRKAGLAEAGEFCTENLAFKKLRNEGCMDNLRQIKKEQIDKQLSLESYNEASNEIEFDWDKIINLRKQGKIKSIRFGNIEIGDRLLTFNGMYCNGILKVEKKNTTYDSKGNFTYEVIGTREEPVGRDCGCNAYAYGDREFEIVDDDVSQSDIIKDKNESVNEDYDDIAVYNASEEELYELSAAIRKYGDGRYYINFHDKKNGEGNLTSCAGPYNTKKEAKQAMKRLRPDYTEIKAKNESIKEELEEKEYQGCKYTILPDGKYCSIKIYAPKGYSFKNGDTWYSTETELKKADKKAKDIIDNEIELKESIKESVQDLTVLTNEDKEYLTKRFSKMYKEEVVPTLINEVQHLLEVCDWYKSKEFIPMKANGFLFSNKIEWEPCTIEEVQNDVGRKNLLVYLDRVSPGRDSLSTKTLKSRKNFIGSNSIEYKIEFKKDYKSIFRGNTGMNEDYIIDKFKEMANKIAADFKAEGYPKSDKYLLDFVEEAVKKFRDNNAGYLLQIDTGNGEAIITIYDLSSGKKKNYDGALYQARINAERKTVKFTDLENSNYAYESLDEGKKREILSDDEYAKFLLSYMSNDPTYEEVLNMLPMINDDLYMEEIKTIKRSKLKAIYNRAVELKKQGITESVNEEIGYYVIDKNGGMEGKFETKSEANAWKRHYNKYNNLDIKNDYILITTTQLNKLEEIGIKDPKEIFKEFKKQNESIKEGLDKMVNKAMNEEDLKAIWKNEMKREPIIDTPDGPIYLQPSEDGKSIEYGTMTNTGMIVDGSVEYDFDYSLDANLNAVYDEITDTYGLNTVSEEDRDLVCTQEKEDRLNSSFTEAAEGIYDPRTILKAYNIEKAWIEKMEHTVGGVKQVLLFIINDYKQILDTHAVNKKDIYTYEPKENEYYLDRTRDTGDVITDYNLEPAQKLVKDWNEGKKWLDPEWLSNFMKEELEPVYHYSVEDIDQRGDDFDNAEEAYEQAKEQLSKLGYEVKELNDDGEFKVLSTSTGVAYTGVIYPSNPELDEDVATLTDKVDQADSDLRDIIDTISSSDLRESLDAVVKKASKGLNEDLDEPIEDEFELIRNALRKYSKSDEAFKDGFVTIDELKDLFSLYQFDIDDITECAKEEGYEIDGDKILDPSL